MKFLKWEALSIILILIIFYYFFQFNNVYTLIAFALGIITAFFLLHKNAPLIAFVILSGILIYFFKYDLVFLPAYLIGANISYLYFHFSKQNTVNPKLIEINLMNTILLASLVFQSSIEKFRGYNKLVLNETSFTILLVILIPLALYFLLKMFSINKIVISIFTSIIAIAYSILCFSFFKEIGVATILIPLISGLIIGIINLFIKNRSIIIEINEFLLLILIPYQIAGLLGISLSFLSAFIYIAVIGSATGKDLNLFKNTVSKLIPLLFVFASSEINENKGIITRFNLVSGYQASWIFIILILIEHSKKYTGKLKNLLTTNEIEKSFPFLISLFTIATIAIIIRLGGSEALSSLPLVISIYLFLFGFVKSKKKATDIEPIEAMSGLLSAISFWVLTRI